MGIYKNLKPEDVALRSFQVHKEFTFTNIDSGSGVYGSRTSCCVNKHPSCKAKDLRSITVPMGKIYGACPVFL